MQTLETYLKGSDLSLSCRELTHEDDVPLPVIEQWAATQYFCELCRSNGSHPFTTVIGSDNGPPDLVDVLDALAVEAAVIEEAGGFEEWTARTGHDRDSLGKRVYAIEVRQSILLRQLLGDAGYEALLWETDRL